MQYLAEYGLFLAETVTFVVAALVLLAGIVAIASKGKDKAPDGKLVIKKLNKKFQKLSDQIREKVMEPKAYKAYQKQEKAKQKQAAKDPKPRKRIFVLDFQGDIRASKVPELRECITAIITTAEPEDRVVLNLESGGGLVHAYGLCASQLLRLREKQIHLTVAIDKVAASGGYMMAACANEIIAAPFSIIGSIGVLAQIPNFHRFLKKHNVDFEQLSAGEFKRTLSVFGENTSKARKKLQQELEETHVLFKDFIQENRPQLDLSKVATGEHWLGTKALELNLVDKLTTSDDYLLTASEAHDLYQIKMKHKKSLPEKLSQSMQATYDRIFRTQETEF